MYKKHMNRYEFVEMKEGNESWQALMFSQKKKKYRTPLHMELV